MFHRLAALYFTRNLRKLGLLSLLLFFVIISAALERENFKLVAALEAVPVAALIAILVAFTLLWCIWLLNVGLSAKNAGQSFHDFVMGPKYVQLLEEGSAKKGA
ncbi:MAG TPA: hypothetical protein VLV55_03745 [Rhizomicrobium sp.]|nr:hypothetical protein [Rhizomicrobium sp.]